MKPLWPTAIALAVLGLFPDLGNSLPPADEGRGSEWISALDENRVERTGNWIESRFRYAAATSLQTNESDAALEWQFDGTGAAIRLGGHNVPAYGSPNLGKLVVSIDGRKPIEIRPRETAREIVLTGNLDPETHRLRIVHRAENGNAGCRIEGFRSWSVPCGELRFSMGGEENAFLVDARATFSGKEFERSSLVRNWMTGQCCLSGIPPGQKYSLQIQAKGWQIATFQNITIEPGEPTVLPSIFLRRDHSTVISGFRFPALNRPAIRKPGETFRARFLGYDTAIKKITLIRKAGPAFISRSLDFKEDKSKAYYYDREVVARLPDDMPAGLYDLRVEIDGGRRTGSCRSPRSVHVVPEYPEDPVFVTFGHLDTSAQYQAEYLERIAKMANLIGADMVLNSNAVNPAYISGALARLDIPYAVNFGNHRFFGHEKWYGDPVNRIDFGPDIAILNYGHPWHHGVDLADALFTERAEATIKIINAFEQNAPLEFLDRHRVSMIHDAHGTGERVMDLGATPTRRIGKTNAVSFRVVRFRDGRVESCTYNGHETKPFPFDRDEDPPLKVTFSNHEDSQTATIVNEYLDPFPNGRLVFTMPAGSYRATHGRVESQIDSDDGRITVVTVRTDIPAADSIDVTVEPESR